jgi:hypothetical protein
MKFPTDPKQRMQIFAAIAIGVIVAIVVIFMFVIQPMQEKQKKKIENITTLKDTLKKASIIIKQTDTDKAERRKIILEMIDFSKKYILPPVLNNYQLKAREIIDAQAKKMDITIEPLREVGTVEIPFKGTTGGILRGYTARVSMKCGVHKLLYFLREIETANPYISVVSVSISGQEKVDPMNHIITVDIQWPIWADPDFQTKLEEMLKETEPKK